MQGVRQIGGDILGKKGPMRDGEGENSSQIDGHHGHTNKRFLFIHK